MFGRSVQLSSSLVKRSPTLGTLVSTKTKCNKLIFKGKITLVPVEFLMSLSIYFLPSTYTSFCIGEELCKLLSSVLNLTLLFQADFTMYKSI